MEITIETFSEDYKFTLWPIDTKFNRIAGIYIFLIIPQPAEIPSTENLELEAEALEVPVPVILSLLKDIIQPYSLLYAGITNNLRGRFSQHHKIQQAIAMGMTHIGILKITSGRKRKKIERKILKYLNPPLNQTWLYEFKI